MDRPKLTVTGVVLDSPDAQELAGFYRRLLGWAAEDDDPGWVTLIAPAGGAGLSFQTDEHFVRPTWPARARDQRMMLHLDIEVEDLAAATAYAEGCGAVVAEYQPQVHVRVCLDPAGHPFCLYLPETDEQD